MIVISDNAKVSEDDEKEKSKQFKEDLIKYFADHGRENFKCPIISGRELDLYKLFREVIGRGGFQVVSETKQWKDVVGTLDLPSSCTSASFTVKNHYLKCLNDYEKHYLKLQSNPSLSKLNPMNLNVTRTNYLSQNINQPTVTYSNNPSAQASIPSTQLNQPNPSQEQKYLGKKIVRNEPELNYFFRNPMGKNQLIKDKLYYKKINVLSAILDMKRVELAFESHITTEVFWAINTLLIFSHNSHTTIYIENQSYLMESITNYIYYCVNNISDISFVIDIIEGKTVIEHERLKEKWSVDLKSRTSNSKGQNYNSNSIKEKSGANTRHRIGIIDNSNFQFLDKTNHTLSLSMLSKKSKDLKEIDQIKDKALINDDNQRKYEEVTEFELMEQLISLIQIIRNLSFTKANEASIIKSNKFMSILYLLFIHAKYDSLVSNALDIITNLSRHILLKECPYPGLLMHQLFKCLINSHRDMTDQALECFRRLTLPNGNEDYFERMPEEFLVEMVNLLISPKNDTRDSALEILYCLSDQKIPTKTRLGKIDYCIQRLVALVCSNDSDNRISKFAACVLSKLAEIPTILKLVMPYEQELFVAASTDDSITKVILGIISN